jgi:uncharacterized protein (DUF1697 family)
MPADLVHVALLRGINVGGHKKVAMSDLRDLATKLGFKDASTLLQSGNLVFRGAARPGPTLERLFEEAASRRLGFDISFLIRRGDDLPAVMAANPFPREAQRDPSRLLVMFLKDAPAPKNVEALQSAIVGREIVCVKGREAYFVFPDGVGRSKVTTALIERKLDTIGTGRNWNTVCKLAALATR